MRTREEFTNNVADALNDRIPNYAQRKAWYRSVGNACNINPRTVECHALGENECTGTVLANYIEHFGSEFEAAVLGRTENAPDLGDKIIALVNEEKGKVT